MQIEIPDELIEKEIGGWIEAHIGDSLRYNESINEHSKNLIVNRAKEMLSGDTVSLMIEKVLNSIIEEKVENLMRRHFSPQIKAIAEKTVQERLSI